MPDEAKLDGWVQSKLSLATEALDTITHYLLDENTVTQQEGGDTSPESLLPSHEDGEKSLYQT